MKSKNIFVCVSCNFESVQWLGKCPDCHDWNSFEEFSLNSNCKKDKSKLLASKQNQLPNILSKIDISQYSRYITRISELDRVLGGGVVVGSVNLIGGEPGIGKSTLLLQLLYSLSKYYSEKILYISGEESEQQIAKRAKRLNICSDQIYLSHTSSWEEIKEKIKLVKATILVIDSIQTTVHEEVNSPAGSISQVREITSELVHLSKEKMITIFLISHINKSGNIAGPKVLEHMVDTVLYFQGDQYESCRILRGIKNRFGSNDEVGLFEMCSSGLKEVLNASSLYIDCKNNNTSGKAISCILEGTRPIFIEVQALVIENRQGNGKRTTQGVDLNRVSMLIAIIEKFFKIEISSNDIYINLVGGTNVRSKDSDLAIISAILSSYYVKVLSAENVFFGEVGLTGEVIKAKNINNRITEATKLGFKRIIANIDASKINNNHKLISIQNISIANEINRYFLDNDLNNNQIDNNSILF